MVLVHTLVTEVLADFVNALEAAHDESLEVKLGSDAHVHRDVQGVEVRDEGTSRSASGNGRKGGRLDLGVAVAVEEGAHGLEDGGTLQEGVLHALVDNEIDVTLAVAKLGVVEGVIDVTIGICLDDRQRLEALGEYCQLLRMDANLARLCAEHIALDADEVAQVEELLEDGVVEGGVLAICESVTSDVDLDASFRVLQFCKSCFAHDALRHDAAGYADVSAVLGCRSLADVISFLVLADDGQVNKVFLYLRAESVCGVLCSGIRVDAQVAQLLQVISADNLLFAQFKYVQCVHLLHYNLLFARQRYKEK